MNSAVLTARDTAKADIEAREQLHTLLCNLTVAADSAMGEIVGSAHSLYYHHEQMSDYLRGRRMSEIAVALRALNNAFTAVSALLPPESEE